VPCQKRTQRKNALTRRAFFYAHLFHGFFTQPHATRPRFFPDYTT